MAKFSINSADINSADAAVRPLCARLLIFDAIYRRQRCLCLSPRSLTGRLLYSRQVGLGRGAISMRGFEAERLPRRSPTI